MWPVLDAVANHRDSSGHRVAPTATVMLHSARSVTSNSIARFYGSLAGRIGGKWRLIINAPLPRTK